MGVTFQERNYIGLAGEFRVMSELLLRGFNPSKSYLQNGYDLILGDGKRIEVKSSHKKTKIYDVDYRINHPVYGENYSHQKHANCHHYVFTFRSATRSVARRGQINKDFDFAICWCMDDNVFYVIPVGDINGGGFSLGDVSEKATHKFAKHRNNWDALKEKP
jgi:hypothetical protein